MSLAWACMFKESYKKTTVRYKDTCQIDRLIKNNGWDIKCNLVSTWECEEPILKRVRFEKEFTPYPHFIVYDFEAILAPLNEHPIDDLSKELVYIVDENLERLIERFIEVLTEKQEAIAADVLKQYLYPSDFQMLPGEVKEQWRQ